MNVIVKGMLSSKYVIVKKNDIIKVCYCQSMLSSKCVIIEVCYRKSMLPSKECSIKVCYPQKNVIVKRMLLSKYVVVRVSCRQRV